MADLHRAVRFYEAALGFQCAWSDDHHAMLSLAHSPGPAIEVLLVETADDARLSFRSSHTGLHHGVLDFHTSDLSRLPTHLRSIGTEVHDVAPAVNEWAPSGFGFFDSEGNRLAAFSYGPHAFFVTVGPRPLTLAVQKI
mgnify:CR=1 FL=1